MPLIQLKQVTLRYGSIPLLDEADLQIDDRERVCLIGSNGTGKTSLMRLITGEEKPNGGEIVLSAKTFITRLDQKIPDDLTGPVSDVIRSGMRPDTHEEDWSIDLKVENIMRLTNITDDTHFESLSGGLKRRALLARALVDEPDLLLLDEPTNHLDIESIIWLEKFLVEKKITLSFVTHDRTFLQKTATRIIELDRGHLTSWACDYHTYLERKAAWLEAEEKQWASFDKKLAQEEVWLRQGVKARRTRNEGRVQALMKMRNERTQRRERDGKARVELQKSDLSGQKVIDMVNVSFNYGESAIISTLTTTIWRGDKIGIIGANGTGKTTLLKLLLKEIDPQIGTVKHGTNLQVVYFDQMRAQIDESKTLAENVAGHSEMVTFQGRNKHINSYLKDFLFDPEKVRMSAGMLSGGERNRLLLAKLFLNPANLMILDEPTNDLDAETLELLEDLLVSYEGTLLLVSHDRSFLDEVVTNTLVFEGDGQVGEYNGGYEDYLRQRPKLPTEAEALKAFSAPKSKSKKDKPRKFLNRERRELEEMPVVVEKLEKEHMVLNQKLGAPETYKNEPQLIPILEGQIAALDKKIKEAYARWEHLEVIQKECEEE
ncbi:MAG: ATP-binding cassette domain-containing protein [Verrucomicrobiota bacterium]|nr:ATP-binding cassette domain-containing protein [Verrucomicrobiota bacterium]